MLIEKSGTKENNAGMTETGTRGEASYGGFSCRWQYDDYVSGDRSRRKKRIAAKVVTAVCGVGVTVISLGIIAGIITGMPSISADGESVSLNTSASVFSIISVPTASPVTEDISEAIEFSSIGCECENTSDEMRTLYNLPNGVKVTSATAASELYIGDVITSVCLDGTGETRYPVTDTGDLNRLLSGYESGETAYLAVFRRGKEFIIAQIIK